MHVLVDLKIAILPWYRHHVHALLATMNNYIISLEARSIMWSMKFLLTRSPSACHYRHAYTYIHTV